MSTPSIPGVDRDALVAAIQQTASRVLLCYGTTITAKSPGLCPRCGTRWSEGDLIWCDSALALPKWQHAECGGQPATRWPRTGRGEER